VQTFTKSAAQLVAAAEAEITALSPSDLQHRITGENPPVLIDIRDIRELSKSGRIVGSVHAPRGMLEFWADPESPYHRDVFSKNDHLVLYCAAGWRSALATKTLQDMGMTGLAHLDGGFAAWLEADLPVEPVENKR
jgi:rhodanese-related sulfurtransferase